jgi:hypothetical protein
MWCGPAVRCFQFGFQHLRIHTQAHEAPVPTYFTLDFGHFPKRVCLAEALPAEITQDIDDRNATGSDAVSEPQQT